LRDRLQDDLRRLFAQLALTVVHVTHDVGEAFALGRRVAVLHGGRIARVAPPEELWRTPGSEWVARFLGMRNVLEVGGRPWVARPEAVRVSPGEGGVVLDAERRGPTVVLTVQRDDGQLLEAATTSLAPPPPGTRVRIEIDPAGLSALTPGEDEG
jgi:ABC-type Fe3+/spermidine/putrescine transport system ATPase subunit